MKRITRTLMSLVSIILIFLLVFPVTAFAAGCNHKYKNDVCKKCGELRLHTFDQSITFYTTKDNVPIWKKPTKNSIKLYEIDSADTSIQLEAILRNQYGNIWLKVEDEDAYIYIDNVYLDFITLTMQNYQKITVWDNDEMRLAAFYDLVKPEGSADYKEWLDPGGKGIEYSVKVNDSYYMMTAEELGNIHYGFLGRAAGFDENVLLYAGGTVNVIGQLIRIPEETHEFCSVSGFNFIFYPICVKSTLSIKASSTIKQIYTECSDSYCDDAVDAGNVKKGIDFFDTGDFSW